MGRLSALLQDHRLIGLAPWTRYHDTMKNMLLLLLAPVVVAQASAAAVGKAPDLAIPAAPAVVAPVGAPAAPQAAASDVAAQAVSAQAASIGSAAGAPAGDPGQAATPEAIARQSAAFDGGKPQGPSMEELFLSLRGGQEGAAWIAAGAAVSGKPVAEVHGLYQSLSPAYGSMRGPLAYGAAVSGEHLGNMTGRASALAANARLGWDVMGAARGAAAEYVVAAAISKKPVESVIALAYEAQRHGGPAEFDARAILAAGAAISGRSPAELVSLYRRTSSMLEFPVRARLAAAAAISGKSIEEVSAEYARFRTHPSARNSGWLVRLISELDYPTRAVLAYGAALSGR